MTPEETKIWNAAVRKCADEGDEGSWVWNVMIKHLLPETEAEHLALECPATDKVEVIAWMLDRRDDEKPVLDAEWFANAEAVSPAKNTPEYVYGPEVPGTTTWPVGTEYEYQRYDGNWFLGDYAEESSPENLRRRIYRIGQQYQHDGSDVCPLADGDQPVEVAYKDGFTARYEFAENASWGEVTRFIPLKGR